MARKTDASASSRNRIAWGAVVVYTFRFIIGGALLIGGLYGFHRAEQFLVKDARFRFIGPEYGFESPSLQVDGVRFTSRPQVLRVFATDFGRSVYLLPLAQRRAQLKALDWVKDASISRIWPNRVLVQVTEREPVAFIQVQVDRFSRVALIDADGKILQQPPHSPFKLPVIAGVLPDDTEPLRKEKVRRLLYLMKDAGNLGDRISEANVRDRNNLIVTAKMENRAVVLQMGNESFGSRLRNFINHYPEIQRRMPGAWKFDLRLDDRITAMEDNE